MTAIIAFFLDTLIGDPRSRFHPVVLIGNLISGLEKSIYHPDLTDKRKFLYGGLLVIVVLYITYALTDSIIQLASLTGNVFIYYGVQALILSFTISPRSLSEAGRELYGFLQEGDLENARYKVGWIVGRDTDKLTSGEVTRATVETIAENTTDGIISPLFFFVIGGVPLAVLYRAANTMDSMLGYKNEKYLYFGRVAARVDDILNYVPARITGILFVISALLLGYNWRNSWNMLMRDASKHPSPNGGWAEASVAGALNIRLGGYNSYFGVLHFREYMGEPIEELESTHIMKCIRMMYTATILFLLVIYCCQMLHNFGII